MGKIPVGLVGRRNVGLGLGSLLLGSEAQAALPAPTPVVPTPAAPAPAAPLVMPPTVRAGRDVATVMGGSLIGTYIKVVNDMANVLAAYAPDAPRIFPIITSGGYQIPYDLVELDYIDAAVVSGIMLDTVRLAGWLPEITNRLAYVSELYFEETHIVSTQLIENVYALDGLTVNVGPPGGGSDVIARRMFELLGIHPKYDNRPIPAALEGVPRGDPAAVVFVAGKPADIVRDIRVAGSLHFVPITWDDKAKNWLTPWFRPATLESSDYPRLVPPGTIVPTVASPVFLVTAIQPTGSPRQKMISAMTAAFLQNLSALQTGPYEPKWREANVLDHLPHFNRAAEVIAWFTQSNQSQNTR
jgi:TRAP-type uncharacterized transport system substrate-binding protein